MSLACSSLQPPKTRSSHPSHKFAVPTRVVSSLEAWVEYPSVQTPRSATAALSELSWVDLVSRQVCRKEYGVFEGVVGLCALSRRKLWRDVVCGP